ncbi:hypothetical protein [Fictibacillus gelatini]|uniref:hypothetical protein n=1 Tax=Fictibacillus gelatini TaxID=225985 RepID=UPI00041447FC|nr:hypothetical protein [Fictibacillus gelatini]
MKSLFNTVYITWLQFKRQPLFWVLLIGFLSYEYLALTDIPSPGEVLTATSFLVQGGILAFLLFGIFVVQIEDTHQLEDLFLTIKDASLVKLLAKLLYGILLALFISFLFYLFYVIYYLCRGYPFTHLFFSAFLYCLLYFGLTFLISYFIGMLLALFIKGKMVFPVSLVVWALIGPVNYIFLGDHLQRVSKWLNLGEPNPTGLYDRLYGLSIDWFYWLKHFEWLVVISIIFVFYLNYRHHLLNKKTTLSCIFVLMLSFGLISYGLSLKWQLYASGINADRPREEAEALYYSKKQPVLDQKKIQVTTYKIDLKIKRSLSARVEMDVQNKTGKTIKILPLSLYHGLKIKRVEANGKAVKFRQQNDAVTVSLKKDWKKGQPLQLIFQYEGNSSPLFYANQRAVYLPYYFNWLPSVNVKPAFQMDRYGRLVRNNHQTDNLTRYVLSYEGRKPLYTNLTKRNNGKWEGKSFTGLTLLSGELQSKRVGSTELIFPGDTKGLNYNEFKSATENVMKATANDLNIKNVDYPDKIMMIPILSIADSSMEEVMWYSPDTLILGNPSNSWLIDIPAYYTYWIVPALTWKYENIKVEDRDYLHAFDLMYSYIYNKKNHIKDDGDFIEWFNKVPGNGSKQVVLHQLSEWLKSNKGIKEKTQFCKQWYYLLHSGNDSWDQLEKLLNTYRKGGKQ